jgi:hypothetical protein
MLYKLLGYQRLVRSAKEGNIKLGKYPRNLSLNVPV